ncbi:MAG: hypothetical protein HYX68_05060 [Planctomycetes bacterium]|jgi:hypothetical protein|nr:hypothetical protein [Planctomycetota bacterium]
MRPTLIAVFFVCVLTKAAPAQQAGAQGPTKSDGIQKDFSYFETWGLKRKTFSLEMLEQTLPDGSRVTLGRITYVLEFDTEVSGYDLDTLQWNIAPKNRRLRHLLFDTDNVAINANRIHDHRLQGEVSGVPGEAFRITFDFVLTGQVPPGALKKVVARSL